MEFDFTNLFIIAMAGYFIVVGFMFFVGRGDRFIRENDRKTLNLPPFIKCMGALYLVMGLGLLAIALFWDFENRHPGLPVGGLALMFIIVNIIARSRFRITEKTDDDDESEPE